MSRDLGTFTEYLLRRSPLYEKNRVGSAIVGHVFEETLLDVIYHFPEASYDSVIQSIFSNSNELIVFLYRLGRYYYLHDNNNDVLQDISFVMKDCCSCEIYFNNSIGEGFYPVHCVGAVVGSRNTIGRGFRIFQGCTIGHKAGQTSGSTIGDDFTMFPGSQVLGDLTVGDRVTLYANAVLLNNAPNYSVWVGLPAKNIRNSS